MPVRLSGASQIVRLPEVVRSIESPLERLIPLYIVL